MSDPMQQEDGRLPSGDAHDEVARKVSILERELDITNADHIVLYLEANKPLDDALPWLACRIIEAHEIELARVLRNPPRHKFWGAGEPDCPQELKAGNGELHTLRCKVCGEENLRHNICLAAVPTGDAPTSLQSDLDRQADAIGGLREKLDAAVDALEVLQFYGCPSCGGDCASANPPVIYCPMQQVSATLARIRGEDA